MGVITGLAGAAAGGFRSGLSRIVKHTFLLLLATPLAVMLYYAPAAPPQLVAPTFFVSAAGYVAFVIGRGHLQKWAGGGLYLAGIFIFLAGILA